MYNSERKLLLLASDLVFLPGSRVQLPISQIVQEELWKTNASIGIAYKNGNQLSAIGCLATIHSSSSISPCADIGSRFIILNTKKESIELVYARVRFFGDLLPRQDILLLARELIAGLKKLSELTDSELDLEQLETLDPVALSFFVYTSNLFSTDERRETLSIRAPEKRLYTAIKRINDLAVRGLPYIRRRGVCTHLLN